MNKQEYCFSCDKDVEFIIKEELIPMNIKGVDFEFIGKVAYCKECGEEIYLSEINDGNIGKANEIYREKLGLIKTSEIEVLLRKYNIGQKPLATLLGWGEATIIRYMQGLTPSKEYSDRLKELMNPYKMNELLKKNGSNLSPAARKKVESSIESILISSTSYESRDVLNVSRFFLNKVDIEAGDVITPLKLQKLVYYAESWSLAFLDQPLIHDDFEAWVHGPVVPSLYNFYKQFGYNPIPKVDSINSEFFSTEELALLEVIWKVYGKYNAKYLEELTHSEEPWRISRADCDDDEKSNQVISKESIKTFYQSKICEYKLGQFEDIRRYVGSMELVYA